MSSTLMKLTAGPSDKNDDSFEKKKKVQYFMFVKKCQTIPRITLMCSIDESSGSGHVIDA